MQSVVFFSRFAWLCCRLSTLLHSRKSVRMVYWFFSLFASVFLSFGGFFFLCLLFFFPSRRALQTLSCLLTLANVNVNQYVGPDYKMQKKPKWNPSIALRLIVNIKSIWFVAFKKKVSDIWCSSLRGSQFIDESLICYKYHKHKG